MDLHIYQKYSVGGCEFPESFENYAHYMIHTQQQSHDRIRTSKTFTNPNPMRFKSAAMTRWFCVFEPNHTHFDRKTRRICGWLRNTNRSIEVSCCCLGSSPLSRLRSWFDIDDLMAFVDRIYIHTNETQILSHIHTHIQPAPIRFAELSRTGIVRSIDDKLTGRTVDRLSIICFSYMR